MAPQNDVQFREHRRTSILRQVRKVPAGSTSTYGQIAEAAGFPKNARLVGRILNQLTEAEALEVPWHRIVSASGKIADRNRPECEAEQRQRLLEEGVEITVAGRVISKHS